jgi:hypothetical protein
MPALELLSDRRSRSYPLSLPVRAGNQAVSIGTGASGRNVTNKLQVRERFLKKTADTPAVVLSEAIGALSLKIAGVTEQLPRIPSVHMNDLAIEIAADPCVYRYYSCSIGFMLLGIKAGFTAVRAQW